MSELFFLTVAAAVLSHVVVPAAHILQQALTVVAYAGTVLLVAGIAFTLFRTRRL